MFIPTPRNDTGQVCTQTRSLVQTADSVRGFDASGGAISFARNPVSVGDVFVYENVVSAGYNPGATIDMVMRITGVNLNTTGAGASTGGSQFDSNGTLSLRSVRPPSEPHITYELIPYLGGSIVGNDLSTGTIVSARNSVVGLLDVDSAGTRDFSDLAGYTLASTPDIVFLNNTATGGHLSGNAPAGFSNSTLFTETPSSGTGATRSWTGAAGSGDNFSRRVLLEYNSFTGGEYLHGATGVWAGTANSRGAVQSFCGEILPPELTTSKTVVSETVNADGSVAVTYTITIENTGDQVLTGVQLTDDLDTIFSGAYDAFIPSTTATTTGGVTAIDAAATIVTDTGSAIGTISTNTAFDGGTDTNIFATNTASLDPGDEISVTYTMHIEPNTTCLLYTSDAADE